MLLTILGAVKALDIIKTGALTYASLHSPGKDEDDLILARMLEEVTTTDDEDDDEPEGYDDIYQELGI
jgi:hypothetical protein